MRPVRALTCLLALLLIPCLFTGTASAQSGCKDYKTQDQAQQALERDATDPKGLDPDKDLVACENLPAAGEAKSDSKAESSQSAGDAADDSPAADATTEVQGADISGSEAAGEDKDALAETGVDARPFLLAGALCLLAAMALLRRRQTQ